MAYVSFVTLCISVIFYLPHAIWRVPVGELPRSWWSARAILQFIFAGIRGDKDY